MKIDKKQSFFFFLFFYFFIFKFFLFFVFKEESFLGGSSDADYYHAVAIGEEERVVNLWPFLLKKLNDYDFYSRDFVSLVIFLISSFFIPWMVMKISTIGRKNYYCGSIFLVIGCYPVLFFYSLDVYRDVFMIFVFLIGLFFLKKMVINFSLGYFCGLIFISAVLFGFRGYLGFSFFVIVCFCLILKYKSMGCRIKFFLGPLFVIYLLFIYSLYRFGVFQSLIIYREAFAEIEGGTNLNMVFESGLFFIPQFLLGVVFQVFGAWFFSKFSILLFFIEGIPFFIIFLIVIKNRYRMDVFDLCLFLFFIIYNTIWVLGNDNVGTAWRLRSLGYIAIYIIYMRFLEKSKYRIG